MSMGPFAQYVAEYCLSCRGARIRSVLNELKRCFEISVMVHLLLPPSYVWMNLSYIINGIYVGSTGAHNYRILPVRPGATSPLPQGAGPRGQTEMLREAA